MDPRACTASAKRSPGATQSLSGGFLKLQMTEVFT
jgi:hypothetical protein